MFSDTSGLFGGANEPKGEALADRLNPLEILKKSNLSHYVDQVSALNWNSIQIATTLAEETEIQIGATKFGGLPDLPPSLEWPTWLPDTTSDRRYEAAWRKDQELSKQHNLTPIERPVNKPLAFIAQVNLSDTAPYDADRLLPESGMLYFFYDTDLEPGGISPADPGGHRVLYYDGDLANLKRTPAPEGLSEEEVFPEYSTIFERKSSLPDFESIHYVAIGMTDDELRKCNSTYVYALDEDMDSWNESDSPNHKMLGHPDYLQGDFFIWQEWELLGKKPSKSALEDPQMVKQATEWRLLLQVDSLARQYGDEGWMWGDVGMIYYTIRKSDLAARDFSKVMLEHQCS